MTWLWEQIVGLWDQFKDFMWFLLQSIADSAIQLLNDLGVEFDPEEARSAIESLGGHWEAVATIVPINEIIGVWWAAYAVILSIRGARWVVGFIPGVQG